jgi:hypothetical protein
MTTASKIVRNVFRKQHLRQNLMDDKICLNRNSRNDLNHRGRNKVWVLRKALSRRPSWQKQRRIHTASGRVVNLKFLQ